TVERQGDLVPLWLSSSDRLHLDNHRAALGRVSYRWCVDRLHALLTHVDVARVDARVMSASRRRAADGAPAIPAERLTSKQQDEVFGGLGSKGSGRDALGTFTSSEWYEMFDTRILQLALNGRIRKKGPPEDYPSS